MKKKNALDSQRLKALFPETPPAFTAFVEQNLNDLNAGKEIPVMKKKLSLGLALALMLTLLVAAVAVAAILSPTAEIFGFLYGKEKEEALLKGDIAAVGEVHTAGDLAVTLEEVVYQTEGNMQGLYGTGVIAPKEGSRVVLIPEGYSPASPAGYTLYYGMDEDVSEDAPTYFDLAEKNSARMLQVQACLDRFSIADKPVDVDIGYNYLPLPDGRVRFTFEVAGPGIQRAAAYDLNVNVSWIELNHDGDAVGERQRDSWALRAVPALSETAKAQIAAQTPTPDPTTAPTAAPGASIIKTVGTNWLEVEKYLAVHPDRHAENIRLEYGEWYPYMANPENEWDVGFFFLNEGDLNALIRDGRIVDLSDNQTIMAEIKNMYPKVQEAVTRDGKTYAVPYAVFGGYSSLVTTSNDVWKKLGWSFEKAPESFSELTALAEEYMALDRQARRGTRFFVDGDSVSSNRRLLLETLVNLAYSEAMAKGDPTAIDTPAFREGLEQIKTAAKALGKKQAAPDNKGLIYGLFVDTPTFLETFPEYHNLYLRLGDTPAFPQRIAVCVINAASPNKEAAIQYVEWLAQNITGQFLPELSAVATANDIGKRNVEDNLLDYSTISRVQAGISEEDQVQIEKLKEMLQSGNYEGYIPDEANLARYRAEVAPNITVMTMEFPVTYDIQKDYLSGKLDADAFIKALQEAAK
jgi:ABC-type glycerol-3-phosphate transport system substrate-binding protein